MKPWLFRILRNLHLDQCRRSWRNVRLENAEESAERREGEPQARWRRISDEQIETAMMTLPPIYGAAYRFRVVDGMCYGQIARHLGVAPSTVGTRLIRARRLLRSFLLAELASQESWDQEK